MRNQWKIVEKITKDRNFYLFGGTKWPKYWTFDAYILHISKSTCNEHAKQHWCATSENLLRKGSKTLIPTYLRAQIGPKGGPLSLILHTPLKELAMCVWSNTNVKPVHFFCESGQCPQFWLTLGSKMVNWAFVAYVVHPSESSSNEHIKQNRCESRGTF